MKILVTGCAGFIGSSLVDSLLKLGHAVIGVDNFDLSYSKAIKQQNMLDAAKHKNFKFINVDVTDGKLLKSALAKYSLDAIINLASPERMRDFDVDPVFYVKTSVVGTINLLELAKEKGVKIFIYASASSVYGNTRKTPYLEKHYLTRPLTPYSASKRSGEEMCYVYSKKYGISAIVLRIFSTYGPRISPHQKIFYILNQARKNKDISVYKDSGRDFVYVDDVAYAIISCLRKRLGYQIINIGLGVSYSIKDVALEIVKLMNSKSKVIEESNIDEIQRYTYSDIKKANKLLGYIPRIRLLYGLAATVGWFNQEVRNNRVFYKEYL